MKRLTLKMRKKERGFTLIELLIVIAILGVLAAVVVPNVMGMFSRGGAQAWSADQKTIRSAVSSYYADMHDPAVTGVLGHYWPTFSGSHNGDATINQIVDGLDWDTTIGDTLAGGWREGSAVIIIEQVSEPQDAVAFPYMDVPKAAGIENFAVAPGSYGTHVWYVGDAGKVYSAYRDSAGLVAIEQVEADFSGVYP